MRNPFAALLERPEPPTWVSLASLLLVNGGIAVAAALGQLRLLDVLLLYWAESAVIGAFSILEMAIAAKWGALFLVPFFCVHAGVFMLVHLLFILTLFGGAPGGLLAGPQFGALGPAFAGLWFPLASLAVSHAVSTVAHLAKPRPRGLLGLAGAGRSMGGFYGRIAVMQVTLIFGGFASMALGNPVWAVFLLVGLKTVADAASHLLKHRSRPAAGGSLAWDADPS